MKPTILIIGAGFGGIHVARALKDVSAKMILIDRRNHHLFQPLLYQVATAGLTPSQIAQPIRSILRDIPNCTVYLDEVQKINPKAKTVSCHKQVFNFDYLVVAIGAETNYFGNSSWKENTSGLKSIHDATTVRKNILRAFEQAESEQSADERTRLLNFVIVGGGPTGVELAGAISELSRVTLKKDFRNIDPKSAKIYLIESGSHILKTFDSKLSIFARQKLERMGVIVLTGQSVRMISPEQVELTDDQVIPTRTVIWAAGVKSQIGSLGVPTKSNGRAVVNDQLQTVDHEDIYIIGDAASAVDPNTGEEYPGIAPVAIQQGEYVGKQLKQRILGKNTHSTAFRYRDKGMLATIGRTSAIGNAGPFRFTGLLAWFIWSVVHVFYLIGFRNRLFVVLDWIWSYFSFQKGSRLIVEENSNRDVQN